MLKSAGVFLFENKPKQLSLDISPKIYSSVATNTARKRSSLVILWFQAYKCWHSLKTEVSHLMSRQKISSFVATARDGKCPNVSFYPYKCWKQPVVSHWLWDLSPGSRLTQPSPLSPLTADMKKKVFGVINDGHLSSFIRNKAIFKPHRSSFCRNIPPS